jgi:sugar fermentation stimulation protein A
MRFQKPCEVGKFQKRYKRFFADIEYQGQMITAHCPNTGSLKSINIQGQDCLFSTTDDPNRKLKFTLEAIKSPRNSWVGVNTSRPNALVAEIVAEKQLNHWLTFDASQNEVKISAESRVDWVLWQKTNFAKEKLSFVDVEAATKLHFVEVKNVTYAENTTALFPDAVTERGQKHILELLKLMERGNTAELLFVVQRTDVDEFSPAREIDPEYARLLKMAADKGLRITPIVVELSETELKFTGRILPVRF